MKETGDFVFDLRNLYNYNCKPTLNNYGFMFEIESPHFIQMMNLVDKNKPIADLGVAFGYTTKRLLENGFQKVVANDLDPRHLIELWNNVPEELRPHLELKPGNVLDLDFENESLDGLVALKWLQFLHGQDVRKVFKKFYDWLEVGGYLLVDVPTPSIIKAFINLIPYDISGYGNVEERFNKRLKNGDEWPGEFYTRDLLKENDPILKHAPEMQNFFSNDILAREAVLAGFDILKLEYFGIDLIEKRVISDCRRKEVASIICYKSR